MEEDQAVSRSITEQRGPLVCQMRTHEGGDTEMAKELWTSESRQWQLEISGLWQEPTGNLCLLVKNMESLVKRGQQIYWLTKLNSFNVSGKIIQFIVYCYSICWFNGSAIKCQTSLQSIVAISSMISGVEDTLLLLSDLHVRSSESHCCPQTVVFMEN